MAVQARATATRQRIINAGIELFTHPGYGETGINDIVDHAGVTTGSFYYHFKTKEELAAVVAQQGWPKAWDVVTATMAPGAGLEGVIAMTFAISDLLKRDPAVWISNHLNQSLGLLTKEGRRSFEFKAQSFITGIANAIRPGDIRSDVAPEEVGNQVWMTLHGCHLLSDALGDSVTDRLVHAWQLLLRSVVPAESQPYFEQFVTRTAAKYP